MSNPKWLKSALLYGPHLALAHTGKEVRKLSHDYRLGLDTSHLSPCGEFWFATRKGELPVAVVLIAYRGSLIDELSLIVHEVEHVWQEYCRWAEEDAPGTELEAYAVQNMCKALFEQHIEWRKSRKGGRK